MDSQPHLTEPNLYNPSLSTQYNLAQLTQALPLLFSRIITTRFITGDSPRLSVLYVIGMVVLRLKIGFILHHSIGIFSLRSNR